MSFGKRIRRWLLERRLRRMPARDLPESEQEIDPQSQYTINEITVADQNRLLKLGFEVTDNNPIGSGAYGSVFRGRTTVEAIRYHPIANIKGDYFEEILEGRVKRYLPVSETIKVDDNYHAEELMSRVVAIKFVFMMGYSPFLWEQEKYRREAQIMARLHHPNIIDIYDSLIIERRLYIVMEYCSEGSLNNFLLTRGVLTQQLCMKFVQNLAAGLLYLHTERVTHGDLHSNNVMVFRSGPNAEDLSLKYVDFGLGEFVTTDITPVVHDVRDVGRLLYRLSLGTHFADAALRVSLQELCNRMSLYEFESMSDAIREYEFLHPEEYARMHPTV